MLLPNMLQRPAGIDVAACPTRRILRVTAASSMSRTARLRIDTRPRDFGHGPSSARNAAAKPTIPSAVRIQCQVAHRSRRDRTAESERPPRSNASFVPAKKIGYVTITPTTEKAAMRSQRRRVAGPRQQATTASP
jgi:hypothetical protein